jgi:hypothetical protein
VFVMDCTITGAELPTFTPPIMAVTVFLRRISAIGKLYFSRSPLSRSQMTDDRSYSDHKEKALSARQISALSALFSKAEVSESQELS